MRRDIQIHINTKDAVIAPQNSYRLEGFKWVSNPTGPSRYVYAEVDVPAIVTEESIREKGFFVSIPYTPQYKEIMLRVRRVGAGGEHAYLNNVMAPEYASLRDVVTGANNWFLLKTGLYGGEERNAFASELMLISEKDFYVKLDGMHARIYSAAASDFNIIEANRQNANCLLACIPGNNYRYPVTGVGLVRWINSSHMNYDSLAEAIQREFSGDGVSVRSAYYNYDTQQMEMDLSPNED